MLAISTEHVAREDQQDFWRSVLRELYFELDSRMPVPPQVGYASSVERITFGGIVVDRVRAEPNRVERTARLARTSPGEHLQLAVLQRGRSTLIQDDRCAELTTPGDFAFVDTSRPYVCVFEAETDEVISQLPRASALAKVLEHGKLTAVRVPGDSGLGAVAAALLLGVHRHGADRDDEVARGAADKAVDLATSALLDQIGRPGPARPHSEILTRAQQFMREHLHASDLTPSDVAAAIPVSERYLYVVFREAGTSPAAWLREARLERAKQLLADNACHTRRTVEAIGGAVGYPRASHFSRLFKERFDMTPGEYRLRAEA